MKERPILMSAPMVRALLDGSKTQTRRVVKDLPPWEITEIVPSASGCGRWLPNGPAPSGRGMASGHWRPCPYGQVGDHLWVRETHRPVWGQTPEYLTGVDYRADPRERWERLGDQIGTPLKWTPSIHMRREYSRILLEITSVRVERLQDISEADAVAEGIIPHVRSGWHWHKHDPNNLDDWHQFGFQTAAFAYQGLWESINDAGSWDVNPWVWVIEFKRIEPDAEKARGNTVTSHKNSSRGFEP